MKLPFTPEQFFNVIENYNLSIFPFQLIITLLGIACLFLLHSKWSSKDKIIGIYLGALWIWIGTAYHFAFFASINKAAFLFGAIFILQGLLILYYSLIKNRLVFTSTFQVKDYLAYFLIFYGLIIYPIISYFVEGSLNMTIMMGLPCPSTIFTFGLFMLSTNKFPKILLIIPTLWAFVGLSAAINIGVYQDIMILVAALVANIFLISRKK